MGGRTAASAGPDPHCPVVATARVISGKWTLLLLRDLAEHESCRFSELERSLAGISPRTLSQRLRALEEQGVVERRQNADRPQRVGYRLTDKGRDLVPIVEAMRTYGTLWMVPVNGAASPTSSLPG